MKLLFTISLTIVFNTLFSQSIVTQFKFNSSFPDANTGSGTLLPSTGSGTISVTGGTTFSYATGSGNDPATLGLDNSALSTTSYPSSTTGDKTAGIQINVSTIGDYGIILDFDQKNSATAANEVIVQYSTDGINYTDFTTITTNTSNTYASHSVNFSGIGALNNNPSARFRIVTSFSGNPGSAYAGTTSTYATSGTLQFDMITISSGGTLPIRYSGFTAFLINNKTKLNWRASCPLNSPGFEIQKSIDGVSFLYQQTVNSKGTNENEYSVTDDKPFPGISYYRLKLLDAGGRYSYSEIIPVKNEASAASSLTMYPNPVKNKLQLEWLATSKKEGILLITDAMGKNLKRIHITSTAGINRLDLKLTDLIPGTYSLQLIFGEEKLTNILCKE